MTAGWVALDVPELSVALVGRTVGPQPQTPLSMWVSAGVSPGLFDGFDLVERASFRALCSAVVAEIDSAEGVQR